MQHSNVFWENPKRRWYAEQTYAIRIEGISKEDIMTISDKIETIGIKIKMVWFDTGAD